MVRQMAYSVIVNHESAKILIRCNLSFHSLAFVTVQGQVRCYDIEIFMDGPRVKLTTGLPMLLDDSVSIVTMSTVSLSIPKGES